MHCVGLMAACPAPQKWGYLSRKYPPPRRKQDMWLRCLLGDQHHARVPGRAVQEQLEKKLRSLRDRAARLKPAAEATSALDQIEQKMELLSRSSGVQEQAADGYERPDRPQAVRQQSVFLKQAQRRVGVAAPPWLGVAIYTLGALALALSFTSATRKAADPVLHSSVVQHEVRDTRMEQLLGHFRMHEAPESELVPVLADSSVRLRGAAAAAFFRMQEAASRDGIRLAPLSGFRSVQEQQVLFYDIKAARVQGASERARVSAPPGFSEHHTGYAVDLGDADTPASDVELEFEQTDAFAWLQRNAARFHFEMSFPFDNPRGIAYEPWHWRFVGDDHSLWTFYGQGQEYR